MTRCHSISAQAKPGVLKTQYRAMSAPVTELYNPYVKHKNLLWPK